jgi:hypothetical protein
MTIEGVSPLIVLLLATALPSPPAGLLPSALDPNPALRSYVANATLVARAHPIPLARTFTGVAYYERPTRKIVFDTVPRALSAFKTLETTIPSYAQATADYLIAPLGDDGKTSMFSLTPKGAGRVTGLTVTVDDGAPHSTRRLDISGREHAHGRRPLCAGWAIPAAILDRRLSALPRLFRGRNNPADGLPHECRRPADGLQPVALKKRSRYERDRSALARTDTAVIISLLLFCLDAA